MGIMGLGNVYTCWNSVFCYCMQACQPQVMHAAAHFYPLWPHSCLLSGLMCYIKGLDCRLPHGGGLLPHFCGRLSQAKFDRKYLRAGAVFPRGT
jgi:hypothetical protein